MAPVKANQSVASEKPHFYRIFYPELYAERLRLPPEFSRHIERDTGRVVSLEGPSENLWSVTLRKDTDGVYFQDGWREFVADHGLSMTDFILFRYDGNLRFTVSLFDKTACEKESAFQATPTHKLTAGERRGAKRRKERVVIIDDEAPTRRPKQALDADGVREINSVLSEGMPEELVRCDSVSKEGSPRPRNNSTVKDVRRRKVSAGRKGRLVSNRPPVSEQAIPAALAAAKSFKSKHPTTCVVIKKSNVCPSSSLNFSRPFVRDHLQFCSGRLNLVDPSGISWEVNLLCSRNDGRLSGGWSAFSRANHLEQGDVCVFELIIHKSELQVHIFRVS